jgi:hypothetical protein
VRAVVTLGGGTNRETGEIIPRRPVVQVGPHHVVGGSPSVDGGGLLTSALGRGIVTVEARMGATDAARGSVVVQRRSGGEVDL